MSMNVTKILATAAIAIALGLSAAEAVISHEQSDHTSGQITQLQQQVGQLRSANAQLGGELGTLRSQVGQISQPSDPLAAYNLICDTTATNNETGITGTYWYPCTNQAQTIPQPGG